MIACPKCGSKYTTVVDSRKSSNESIIRRRRRCEKCDKRFTTYEITEQDWKAFENFKNILEKAGYVKRGV